MNSNNVSHFRGKKKGCWKEAINSRELVEKPAENKDEKEWEVESTACGCQVEESKINHGSMMTEMSDLWVNSKRNSVMLPESGNEKGVKFK